MSELVSQLISRIISGRKTNLNLSLSYSFHKSLHHKSLSLSLFFSKITTQIVSTISECKPPKQQHTRFGAYFYSAGTHSTREPASIVRNEMQNDLSLFCGPTQEPVLATANTEKKSGAVLEKMQVNGPER